MRRSSPKHLQISNSALHQWNIVCEISQSAIAHSTKQSSISFTQMAVVNIQNASRSIFSRNITNGAFMLLALQHLIVLLKGQPKTRLQFMATSINTIRSDTRLVVSRLMGRSRDSLLSSWLYPRRAILLITLLAQRTYAIGHSFVFCKTFQQLQYAAFFTLLMGSIAKQVSNGQRQQNLTGRLQINNGIGNQCRRIPPRTQPSIAFQAQQLASLPRGVTMVNNQFRKPRPTQKTFTLLGLIQGSIPIYRQSVLFQTPSSVAFLLIFFVIHISTLLATIVTPPRPLFISVKRSKRLGQFTYTAGFLCYTKVSHYAKATSLVILAWVERAINIFRPFIIVSQEGCYVA